MGTAFAADEPRAGGTVAAGSVVPGSGEQPTFLAVYESHFDFVWRSARRLGVSKDALDDVVQEVFLVVLARLETLEKPEALRSWIFGIVRRTVIAFHRRQRDRRLREQAGITLENTVPDLGPSPLDLAVSGEEVQLLWRLLGKLDGPKREVLILSELEQMTVPEIAEVLEIPVNTAYSRLRIARIQFEQALQNHRATERNEKTP